MIEHLELINLTAFDQLALDLSPGINIIIGENGTGKTHVLIDTSKTDQVRFHSLFRDPGSSGVKVATTDDYQKITPNPIDEAFGLLINQEIENDMGALGK